MELAESFQAMPVCSRQAMGQVDTELAAWVRQHRYLQPVEVLKGECSMALLLLWEVEHARSFPSAAPDLTGRLMGFTKRLTKRVSADEELQWLSRKDVQVPLAPGLPETHHTRWSLRIVPPPAHEPRGWYEEFISRWRAYLGSLAQPTGCSIVAPAPTRSPPTDVATSSTSSTPGEPAFARGGGRRRPRSVEVGPEPAPRRRTAPPERDTPAGTAALLAPSQPAQHTAQSQGGGKRRPRSPAAVTQHSAKRQRDMRAWLQPKPQVEAVPEAPPPQTVEEPQLPEHGRAAQGPPT